MRPLSLLLLLILGGCSTTSPITGSFDPFALQLGATREETISTLRAQGHEPLRLPGDFLQIDWPALPDLYESQRTMLRFDDRGRLQSVHIILDPQPGASGRQVLRLADDVRKRVIARLGRPAWERREDAASGEVLYGLSNGEIIRMTQWEFPPQRFIRAGIPRRVSGEVAVEVAITPEPAARGEEFWGLAGG